MPGLLRMMGRTAVVAGTASAVGGRVHRRQERKWAQQDQEQAPAEQYAPEPQQQAAPPPPPPEPAVDPIQRLKDLADLKQQGVLTDDEFAVQKAKILAA
jgi:Short C-terminal domain